MRNPLFIILLFFSLGCSSKAKPDTKTNSSTVEKPRLLSNATCIQKSLSNQFDLIIEVKPYADTTAPIDSCAIKIVFRQKSSSLVTDSIVLPSVPNFRDAFTNCNSMKSYTTGFNSEMDIVDNYFGDIVVADLNFDTLDDIAIINDTGGNGGSEYLFYTQTPDKKFKPDKFLTDSMHYFPQKINNGKHQLTTYVHAGACCVGQHIYQLDNNNNWRQISHKILH